MQEMQETQTPEILANQVFEDAAHVSAMGKQQAEMEINALSGKSMRRRITGIVAGIAVGAAIGIGALYGLSAAGMFGLEAMTGLGSLMTTASAVAASIGGTLGAVMGSSVSKAQSTDDIRQQIYAQKQQAVEREMAGKMRELLPAIDEPDKRKDFVNAVNQRAMMEPKNRIEAHAAHVLAETAQTTAMEDRQGGIELNTSNIAQQEGLPADAVPYQNVDGTLNPEGVEAVKKASSVDHQPEEAVDKDMPDGLRTAQERQQTHESSKSIH